MDRVEFSNKDLKTKGPWSCLSNYFVRETFIQGYPYPTVEHYFQAQKFAGKPALQEQVRKSRSGLQAKKLAEEKVEEMVGNWEEIKDAVMQRGVEAKFAQHADLKDVLLSTDQAEVVYVSSTGKASRS